MDAFGRLVSDVGRAPHPVEVGPITAEAQRCTGTTLQHPLWLGNGLCGLDKMKNNNNKKAETS